MNLEKLFEMQRKLDERIEQEHPRQEGEDRLAKKILALQVELGELANEWRGFKYWSYDREPRTVMYRQAKTKEGRYTRGLEKYNPLLEEYVDCLHFLLSIGLELKLGGPYVIGPYIGPDLVKQFNFVFQDISELNKAICEDYAEGDILDAFDEMVRGFIGLGEMLGFTWEEIEKAYLQKNAVNFERQENGY